MQFLYYISSAKCAVKRFNSLINLVVIEGIRRIWHGCGSSFDIDYLILICFGWRLSLEWRLSKNE